MARGVQVTFAGNFRPETLAWIALYLRNIAGIQGNLSLSSIIKWSVLMAERIVKADMERKLGEALPAMDDATARKMLEELGVRKVTYRLAETDEKLD